MIDIDPACEPSEEELREIARRWVARLQDEVNRRAGG